MTVKVRPYKRGGWEYDIMLALPGRPLIRERRKSPVAGKVATRRWAEERERQLVQHATTNPTDEASRPDVSLEEVPTLAQFAPRYIEGHCKANQQKPSTILARESSLRSHLIPHFGRVRLDRITAERIQRFKVNRTHLKNSTVNNHLTVLRVILNAAVEWGVIEQMPTKIKLLKEAPPPFTFYDFDEFDRLVLTAEQEDKPSWLLAVLLGGEAGLRAGEMSALKWSDIDLRRGTLTVQRSRWRQIEGTTKSGRTRSIPLAERLWDALRKHRHLHPYVLLTERRTVPPTKCITRWVATLQAQAGLKVGKAHALRHTFCSHLAMAGKPASVIQALAGHASITTTERYMHLAPGATRDAIDGLTRPPNWRHVGDAPRGVTNMQQFQHLSPP